MTRQIFHKLIILTISLVYALATDAQDAEASYITTVADKGESGMCFATLCPVEDVAIDSNDAELFSMYADNGNVILMKMRVQGGLYMVKAGDCVVIKTTETKAVALEATSVKRSSVWVSDVFCPSEDLSTTEFSLSYPVGEGETIYLLTNSQDNGGFGFTKFTGDTMRKGCFFVVAQPSTGIETRSAVGGNMRSSMTYNLQGYPQAPVSGKLYIQNGRKFVAGPSSQSETHDALANTRAAVDLEDGDYVPILEGEAGNDDGFTTTPKPITPGDVNGDDTVDATDVSLIGDHIIGQPTTVFLKTAADVNADHAINVADIVGTVNLIAAKAE